MNASHSFRTLLLPLALASGGIFAAFSPALRAAETKESAAEPRKFDVTAMPILTDPESEYMTFLKNIPSPEGNILECRFRNTYSYSVPRFKLMFPHQKFDASAYTEMRFEIRLSQTTRMAQIHIAFQTPEKKTSVWSGGIHYFRSGAPFPANEWVKVRIPLTTPWQNTLVNRGHLCWLAF